MMDAPARSVTFSIGALAAAALACAEPHARGGLGPFGEAGDIPGCILGESFDTLPSYVVLPVDPQDEQGNFALPDGGSVGVAPGYGVVDNAAAISSPTYNGPPGGPDPTGERGGMLHLQRASLGDAPIPGGGIERVYSLFPHSGWYWVHPSAPSVFITLDVYKNKHTDFMQILHHDFVVLARIIAGGYWGGTSAPFGELAALRGDPDVLEGMIVTGDVAPGATANFRAPKDIPEQSWCTIGLLMTLDENGSGRPTLWLRDRETTGEDGGPVARTPIRTTGPHAGERMFSEFGHGLEEGWAQVFPGTEDDPATPDAVEGCGPAVYIDPGGEPAPAPYVLDAAGNRIGLRARWGLYAYTYIHVGVDPTQTQLPGYKLGDWWLDNYCIRGGVRWPRGSCRADFNIDGVVDAQDLAELLAAWGDDPPIPGYHSIDADDPAVSSSDLAEFLAQWGACP